MLIAVENVLDAAELTLVRGLMDGIDWQDGTKTAGKVAAAVKQNQQADLTSRSGTKLQERLKAAISGHAVIQAAAQPAKYSKLLISKTGAGGGYGLHIDNPFMGSGGQRLRTDLSFTLFLSDPGGYEGGELTVEHAGATQSIKLEAGSLILYPSTSLHRVETIISGERLACVGWIESTIKDSLARETLFDLQNLQAELRKTASPQSPELLTLSKAIANLKRLHSS